MKALALVPGTKTVRMADRPEPQLSKPDEIKLKVLRVGICGTDREEVAGGRSRAPEGSNDLVIGHEMLGRVVEVGKDVRRVKPGDLAVFTVRRGCGKCTSCLMNRSDMCSTGDFSERGIWGMDGYETECVVDKEQYVVYLSPELGATGVLTEPTSVVEKAIDESVRLQTARLPDAPSTPDWLHGRRCFVAGLGPIGLLGAMVLRLRGAEVYGLDIVDGGSARPRWLEDIGGKYIDGRKVPVNNVASAVGPMDLILEAAGIPSLDFNLLDALATNGVYVLTGIPGGDRPLQIPGAMLMRQLVLKNQVIVGSVNAGRDFFQMAADDLARADLIWKGYVDKLITHRYACTDFAKAFGEHPQDEIKSVIEWAQ
ncbi:MAG TPA: glucose 1-dehydrogenase [Bacteroidota bacterium]|nr:glucose 1-dehydrogenase [Bacteroidota bacterium]